MTNQEHMKRLKESVEALRSVNLSGANLFVAILRVANLYGADLSGAILSCTEPWKAKLYIPAKSSDHTTLFHRKIGG